MHLRQASKAADDEVVQPSDLASGGSRYNPAELMYQARTRAACQAHERHDSMLPAAIEQDTCLTAARPSGVAFLGAVQECKTRLILAAACEPSQESWSQADLSALMSI